MLLPPLLILIFFAKDILGLFGRDFTSGSGIFILIMAGQVINVITGPCTFLLSMVGYDKILRNLTTTFTVSAIVAGYFAIKGYGIWGAALVNFLFVAITNIINFFIIINKIYLKQK